MPQKMDERTKKIVVRGSVPQKELVRTKEKAQEDQKIRRSLHYINADGVLSSASSSIFTSYLTPFALFLKATPGEIGLLTAVENLASTFSQIPGAKATEFYSRKGVWLFSRLMSRFAFVVPLVLLPFLGLANPVTWLIIISAFIFFFMSFNSPAWSSIVGDIVPQEQRGRYFGRRNVLMGIATVAATLGAGFLLTELGFPTIFIMFGAIGMLALPFFMKVYEKPQQKVFHYRHSFGMHPSHWIKAVRMNRGLSIFTVYLVLMNFAVMVASPFYAVYMLQDLQMSYTIFALLTTLGIVAKIVSYSYWGKLNDRFGSRKTFMVTAFFGCFIPFLWLWAHDIVMVALVLIVDGLVWSGFELVSFDYLLDIVPADKRPQYIANHNFFVGLGVVAGAFIGALIATQSHSVTIFIFTGLQILFLVSFVLRIAFLSVLVKIPEISIANSLVPVRYVFWQAAAVGPIRGMQHAVAFTFRYPEDVKKQIEKEIDAVKYKYRIKKS